MANPYETRGRVEVAREEYENLGESLDHLLNDKGQLSHADLAAAFLTLDAIATVLAPLRPLSVAPGGDA